MKFSLSWLREHLDTDAALDRITGTLSSIGLEVEGVEDRGAALGAFRTAVIIEAVQHPNADRLRVCRVDAGDGEVSVVCGAPNARTGLHAVFAPPGSVIPGSGLVLKVGEIRGVASAGMLVSARELGLGEDHDGIIELAADAPIGMAYAEYAGLSDPVIEIGVTPNRGDALSVRGVARDLAAAGLGRLLPAVVAPVTGRGASAVQWDNQAPDDCPWVLGRTIRGVRNGASPEWLQRRLSSIGLRPISALVDITNFFTFDKGRPLHVFDANLVSGGVLVLRRGGGECFRALNGRDITVGGEDLVIADASGVQSLAGVIGGEATGSSEATTDVFVECALFDPVRVALSGRRHAVSSDARQRFERGIDPSMLPAALDAATRMIMEICGGEASEVASAGAEPAWRRQASLRFARIAEFGGAAIAPDDAVGILERLGFATMLRDADSVTVAVPPWRNDVAGTAAGPLDQFAGLDADCALRAADGAAAMEPECDLLEEVLRIHRLDRIEAVSLPRAGAIPGPALTAAQGRTAMARRVLASRGLAECVTTSFTARALTAEFGGGAAALTLLNPIAADLDQMRPSPLVMLVQAAKRNADRGAGDVGLFEVGPGYTEAGQMLVAAGLRAGQAARDWRTPGAQKRVSAVDPLELKADLLAVLAALRVPMEAITVTADAPGYFHPGRSGVVRQGPKLILAQFGALHPALLRRLELDADAGGFEIFLDRVQEPKRKKKSVPDLPAFQAVRRDFAFVVATDVAAESVLRAARMADRTMIARVGLFDVYEGGVYEGGLPEGVVPEGSVAGVQEGAALEGSGVNAGQKSLGIEVVFQPRERTMTEQEIEAACARVVEAVRKATGARLRL